MCAPAWDGCKVRAGLSVGRQKDAQRCGPCRVGGPERPEDSWSDGHMPFREDSCPWEKPGAGCESCDVWEASAHRASTGLDQALG